MLCKREFPRFSDAVNADHSKPMNLKGFRYTGNSAQILRLSCKPIPTAKPLGTAKAYHELTLPKLRFDLRKNWSIDRF
jgi:hypothetical protein